ncbi:MAG: hypothetical protein CVU84_16950 [Firmicutes bacterium HGW-Firmicutes-1]|jgi:hypothetical protein|nr:MAG: hypothetical protein CVU84_16950 [Firmicutes bacterium HGW-Firmicutes-1]
MLKRLLMISFMVVLAVGVFTACGKKESSTIENESVDEVQGEIQGEMEMSLSGEIPSDLPKGFPQEIPFYENAKVIDADTFGEDGFTVVYSVDAAYDNVVGFYMSSIEEMDESGIGEEESYFEGMDIDDIHINGLTITDAGNNTQVFITMRKYKTQSGDDSEEEYVEEEDESIEISYENAVEVPLDNKYPSDVVPIYPDAKIIECSLAPSGSGFVDLVLPAYAYHSAVEFYNNELGLKAKNFTSDLMVSETFEGEVKGWKIVVRVAQLNTGNNDPAISITVNNK